jgi:DNA repair photolyase
MKPILRRFDIAQNPPRFAEKELSTSLGRRRFIFIGSSCDIFADAIPDVWIWSVINYARAYDENQYLFQTKNPERFTSPLFGLSAEKDVLCTTIETDQHLAEIMRNAPSPFARAKYMAAIKEQGFRTMVTIEPIMDFNLENMLFMLKKIGPEQVNIGADSGHNHLPEPPKEKIIDLVAELRKFTRVVEKKNLGRLIAYEAFQKIHLD